MQHEKAALLGIIAHVEHNEGHTAMVHGQLIYVAPGVSDYTATLEGGRSAAVEAKSVEGDRFARSGVSDQQQKHLDAVSRAGGLALLVVDFHRGVRHLRFAIPWLEVPWVVKISAQSINPICLAGWEVHSECYLLRWHPGGPRSSISGSNFRKYPTE